MDPDLLDEFRRLENHHVPTATKTCAARLAEAQPTVTLAALSVKWLRRHAPDIVHDVVLSEVPMLGLRDQVRQVLPSR